MQQQHETNPGAAGAPLWRCEDVSAPGPGSTAITVRLKAEALGNLKGNWQGLRGGRLELDLPNQARDRFRAGGVYTHNELAAAEQLAGATSG